MIMEKCTIYCELIIKITIKDRKVFGSVLSFHGKLELRKE